MIVILLTVGISLVILGFLEKPKRNMNTYALFAWFALAEIVTNFFVWKRFGLPFMHKISLLVPFPPNENHTLAVGLVFFFMFGVYYLGRYLLEYLPKVQLKWTLKYSFSAVIIGIGIFLSTLFFFSSDWAMSYFGNLRFDQIVFTLSQPLEGSDNTHLFAYLKGPLLNSAFLTIWLSLPFLYILQYFIDRRKQKTHWYLKPVTLVGVVLVYVFTMTGLGIHALGYADVKAYYFEKTKIYDESYVDTKQTEIVFPEKKRNLIYIYLESMENTYAAKENGGAEDRSLIPNLTNYALNEGTSFSNTDQLGGMISIPGANQTVSSMFAQTSGLPLRTSGGIDVNDYGGKGDSFMPGAYALGEVLHDEGYNQMLYIGSPASFGGRDKYFMNHGEYEIRDYFWIKGQQLIPQDYSVWWGVEDEKLFPFAKDSITELANKGEPFNFTMLTTDTHFEDGYASDQTPNLFNDQYRNVIHYSDQQVFDFVNWIKEQPFYPDTTIVIVGDHPTMDRKYTQSIPDDYQRSVYNVILNSPTTVEKSNQERTFNATDMFPTTLAALGAKIEGDRLGLGTNLYSDKPTLMEELGQDKYINEISKKSDFYNKNIIKGTDYAIETKEQENK